MSPLLRLLLLQGSLLLSGIALALGRELLEPAKIFYQRQFGRLGRPSRGWSLVTCCFHEDKTPSLSLNLETGGFFCFGCGARGGDIVSFVMQRDHIDFPSACKSLGCWREHNLSESERSQLAEQKKERERAKQTVAELATCEHHLRMGYRSEIHALEAVRREATARLGNPETSLEDIEKCWDVLALIEAESRECQAAYALLCFGMAAAREEFVKNPARRDHAVVGILNRGYVQDDAGHTVEVPL